MRRAAHVDRNQADVVKALRKVGASVEHLHAVGGGCPDLLVGFRGTNWLLEVKPATDKDQRALRLRESQRRWHAAWAAPVHVVHSPEQALAVIGIHSTEAQ